jgi:hypothetical protein
MKQHFELRAAGALLALLVMAGPALAQQQGNGTAVYTWVDKQGVRHYSDQPGAPNAVLVTLSGPSTMPAPAALSSAAPPETAKTAAPASAPAAASAAKAAQLAARCTQLRNQLNLLQSARRVEVKHKDGSTEWLTGEEVVKYRANLEMKMQQACSAAAAPGT